MIKRVLAFILAASTAMTMLTGTVLADEQTSSASSLASQSSESNYDTELTPIGSSFKADGIEYTVTSLTEAQVTSVVSADNPTTVTIPSTVVYNGDTYTVTATADGAFAALGATQSLVLPASLTHIGSGAMLSSLKTITLKGSNSSLFLQDGVLYEKTDAGNELVLYPSGSDAVSFVIPDGTTAIRSDAFYGVKNLATVVIPSSVKTIAQGAFASFASPAAFAFDTDQAPESVASGAFDLTAASNTFYFKNADILKAIRAEASDFAGSSDAAYITTGIPDSIRAIISQSSGSAALLGSADLKAAGEDGALEDGYYIIHSALNSNFALDINKGIGSYDNGGNADVNTLNDGNEQIFKVTKVDSAQNLYTFTSVFSNKVLDVAGRGTTDGTNLQQYESNGTIAQQFKILQTGTDGVYTIQCGYSELVVDLMYGQAVDGQNVQMWTSNGTAAQKWQFEKVTDPTVDTLAAGIYTIHTSINATGNTDTSTRVIDVANGSTKNNANVQIWDSNGSNAQKYLFIPLGSNNRYYIINASTRKALDVTGGSTESGANVQMYTENNTAAQTWYVKKTADGFYSIRNAGSGKSLDISCGISANGQNVQIWDSNGSPAQKWVLEKTSAASVSGYYNIVSATNQTKAFDIPAASLDDGAVLQVYNQNGTNAQTFKMESLSGSTYTIRNAGSGKVIDIPGGAIKAGNTLQQYTANGTVAQQWTLVATGDTDGSYYLQSSDATLRLGLQNGATDASRVILATANDTDTNQKWMLQATELSDGWQTLNGVTGYVINGQIVKNTWVGSAYVDGNGQPYTGWYMAPSNGNPYLQGYYYYFDGRNGAQSDARPYMRLLFATKNNSFTYNNGSSTGTMVQTGYDCHYTIYIDRANSLVTVYTSYPGTTAANLPVWEFKASPGAAATPTDAGHTTTRFKQNWYELMGPSYGQYVTLINNAGEYFHSMPCNEANDHNVDASMYNLLGTQQSHGCVRLCVRSAYWLYAFCWMGTDIYVGDNYVHPINTFYQPKMSYNQWIDPTDVHYTGNYGYVDSGVYYGSHW